jgi:hypothetical protein
MSEEMTLKRLKYTIDNFLIIGSINIDQEALRWLIEYCDANLDHIEELFEQLEDV